MPNSGKVLPEYTNAEDPAVAGHGTGTQYGCAYGKVARKGSYTGVDRRHRTTHYVTTPTRPRRRLATGTT